MSLRVGIVQLRIDADANRTADNREQSGAEIRTLFERGAKLVVLPELTNIGYFPSSRDMVEALSEDLDHSESVQQWQTIAYQYQGYIVGGILERDARGIYNTAVLVGSSGVVAKYRKIHLFNWETQWLIPGTLSVTAYLKDLDVTVGLLICYDLRFPEAVQRLADEGADVVAVPTTWTSMGKPILWEDSGYCLQNHLVIAHAYCNRLAFVCADRVGHEYGVTYLGASIAVQPSGMVAAGPLGGTMAQSQVAEIDIEEARAKSVGQYNDLVRDRRENLGHIGYGQRQFL